MLTRYFKDNANPFLFATTTLHLVEKRKHLFAPRRIQRNLFSVHELSSAALLVFYPMYIKDILNPNKSSLKRYKFAKPCSAYIVIRRIERWDKVQKQCLKPDHSSLAVDICDIVQDILIISVSWITMHINK